MTHGDDHLEVNALDLGDQVVELCTTFWLQHRFVEIKESVGGVGHLGSGCRSWSWGRCWCRRGCSGSGWGRCWCSSRSGRSNDGAIAAWSGRGRRPVGVTPAVFVGTVFPNRARSVPPVVDGLSACGGCERCRGKQHRHFVQFLHGSPLGERAAAARRVGTLGVTTTLSVRFIMPDATLQLRLRGARYRSTKSILPRYVAPSLHSLSPKMDLNHRTPSSR